MSLLFALTYLTVFGQVIITTVYEYQAEILFARLSLKFIKWFVIAFASMFVLAFVYGMYLGVVEPDSNQPLNRTASEKPIVSAPEPVRLHLPEPLDARAAGVWLIQQGYLDIEGEKIRFDAGKFSALHAEDALRIYRAFFNTPNHNDYRTIRLLFFALCAHLPEAERDRFAEQAGAVLPAKLGDHFTSVTGYRGDYLYLMYMYDAGKNKAIFAHALRAYAAVLNNAEMTLVLKQYGAYNENEGGDGDWNIRVKSKMKHYDAATLRAMHDAVEPQILGQNRYLRRELMDVIKQKSEVTP